MPKFEDLTGRRFTSLEVICLAPQRDRRNYWHCMCDCGNTKTIIGSSLVSGRTKSCGCIQRAFGSLFNHRQPSRKNEPLTHDLLLSLFSYDQETGALTRKKDGRKTWPTNGQGYYNISVDGKRMLLHRLAWFYVHGAWPNQIDHINGDKTDNRITNLRSVSHTDNMRNRPRYKSNTSGVTGVHWREDRKCWRAMLGHKRLGHFKTKVEATLARKHAEEELGYHKNHGRTP